MYIHMRINDHLIPTIPRAVTMHGGVKTSVTLKLMGRRHGKYRIASSAIRNP